MSPGSDIQIEVNKAIAAGGGVICLSAGTWTLSSTLKLGSNITLTGAGQATTIQGPSTVYNWELIGLTTPTALQNVTVSNIVIDGRVPASAAFDVNNGYWGALGIYFFASSKTGKNLTISGVEIHHTSEALHAKGFDGVTVADCYFHDNGVMLLPSLGNHNFYLYWDSNVTVSNVRSNNSWAGDGLHLRDITGTATIKDSTFVGNYRLGIHTQLDSNPTTNTVATNNDISYNGSNVIYLSTYDGRNMNGLDVETVTGTVAGNTTVGNLGQGIVSRYGTGAISGNIATGNGINPQIYSYGLTVGSNLAAGPFADGTYKLVLADGSALSGLGTTSGSSTAALTYTAASSQKWVFTNLGNSEYSIKNAASGLALTASGASSGSSVVVANSAGADNQVWRSVPAVSGSYRLCAKSAPGVCLNASGSTANMTSYASSSAEQWRVLAP